MNNSLSAETTNHSFVHKILISFPLFQIKLIDLIQYRFDSISIPIRYGFDNNTFIELSLTLLQFCQQENNKLDTLLYQKVLDSL